MHKETIWKAKKSAHELLATVQSEFRNRIYLNMVLYEELKTKKYTHIPKNTNTHSHTHARSHTHTRKRRRKKNWSAKSLKGQKEANSNRKTQ